MPDDDTRRRRTVGPATAGLGVVALLLGGAALYSDGDQMQRLRTLTGLETRLGQAPAVPAVGGTHAFMATQPGSDEPVGYSPCRPITYQVNPEGAPDGYQDYVDGAVSRISAATGLVFEYAGTTGSRDFGRRGPGREPVIVAWADEHEVPELAGDIAGIAGSTWREDGSRHRVYVTGQVVLDSATFDNPSHPRRSLQGVVNHEFGHLVGLGHVDDPTELMYDRAAFSGEFGPGDLEGLARLGNIPC